jgi:hypothetical protein
MARCDQQRQTMTAPPGTSMWRAVAGLVSALVALVVIARLFATG